MHYFAVRVVLLWLLIALVETVHGILRTLFLVPLIGTVPSNQFGVVFGSLLIILIAVLTSNWLQARSLGQQISTGIIWVLLMLAFEIGLGRALGLSWGRLLADYDPRQGGLMVLGIGVLFLSPWLAAKLLR